MLRNCFLLFFRHFNPLSPHDALKHHFTSLNIDLNFLQLSVFSIKHSMKLVCQYMVIFFNFSHTSNHFHPLQVENCDSNSRLVVDEDDNGKLRLQRVKLELLTQFPASNDEKYLILLKIDISSFELLDYLGIHQKQFSSNLVIFLLT